MAHGSTEWHRCRVQESRGDQAAARGRDAARRAEDLRQRLDELRATPQQASTTGDLHLTRTPADVALHMVDQAREHARAAYLNAAQAHRRAADLLDTVGESRRAQDHRQAAVADDDAADAMATPPILRGARERQGGAP
jgi:hypothetical protein